MRKALSLMALGAVTASTSVQANDNWYVAVDFLKTDLKSSELNRFHSQRNDELGLKDALNFNSGNGVGLSIGTQLQYSNNFSLAWEFEYIHYGTFTDSTMLKEFYYFRREYEVEAQSFNFNVKPKYYFSSSGFYLGAIAGVGVTKADFKYTEETDHPELMYLNSTYTDDGSDFGFNYGIETGYEFTSGVVVSGGYRASSVEIDVEGGSELDLDFDSFYVGVEYHFGP
ncbi:hypothetical protein BTO10_18620 [Vibrio chagasii]|uniref:Outer membrane protein beta-barrel domain-containing protein n=1 Tax=Vibrio chagasii TaxID=170679 RepID=A0A2S7VGX6_9VIBR|nr:outer membrane beta-barrel protein [Vibrio chagasii]PQJ61329.1 hypothetical protein BTO10_18620 [Vibrio chagasii]